MNQKIQAQEHCHQVGLVKIFLIVFLGAWASPIWASSSTLIFDAEFVEKDTETNITVLKKNANVVYESIHLLADEIIIYENQNLFIAKGSVVLENLKTTFRGEKAEFNYKTKKGKLYKGLLTSGKVLFESSFFEKVGEKEYWADNGYFTACVTCPSSWSFTGSRVHAILEDSVSISKPWLYLLQVPILPLPYLVIPLKAERRTGFLVPIISQSITGGLTFDQSFFWAIDRSQDATFSLLYYEKRGLQGYGNYRYILDSKKNGELNGAYIKDQSINGNQRWFLEYKHSYQWNEGYSNKVHLAMTSDRQYSREFPRQFPYNGYPATENHISFTSNTKNSHFAIDVSYYMSLIEGDIQRLKNPNRASSPTDIFSSSQRWLQRLPEINYSLMDQKLFKNLNFFANLSVQYLNVNREDRGFDHVRNGEHTGCKISKLNGVTIDTDVVNRIDNLPDICIIQPNPEENFTYGVPNGETPSKNNYGDLIREGQRLDVQSRIHYPFWLGKYLDLDPSFTTRYTQYALGVPSQTQVNYNAYPARFYTQMDLSAKSYISRVYGLGPHIKIKHSIIPELHVRYIPNIYQSKNHFFGNTNETTYSRQKQPIDDTDLDWRNLGRGIHFDQRDWVVGQRFIDLGFTTRIKSRKDSWKKGFFDNYQENFLFSLFQSYDLQKGSQLSGQSWQDLNVRLGIYTPFFNQDFFMTWFPYHKVSRWVSRSQITINQNSYVGINYTQSYTIEQNPPVDLSTKVQNISFTAGLNLRYVNLFGQLEYDNITTQYKRWTLSSFIKPPGECWILSARATQRLDTEDINYSLNMKFQFGS